MTGQYFWSIVFATFFVLLVVMLAIILETESRIPLGELELVDYALITLATWRLTRLFVYDNITRFVREQFLDVVKAGRGYRFEPPKGGARRVLHDLFACPWCFAVWAATFVTFAYLITSYALYPILILAISGVATLLQLTTNLIGHKAELAKRESE